MIGQEKATFPLLHALLLIAALVLTIFGTSIYGMVTGRQEENYALRSTLAYVQTRLAAADRADGVSVAEGPEGCALVLQEGESGYETRIYLFEGQLREELSRCGSPYEPSWANCLAPVESFSVTEEGGLLRIDIDGRQALAALRTEGGRGR